VLDAGIQFGRKSSICLPPRSRYAIVNCLYWM